MTECTHVTCVFIGVYTCVAVVGPIVILEIFFLIYLTCEGLKKKVDRLKIGQKRD